MAGSGGSDGKGDVLVGIAGAGLIGDIGAGDAAAFFLFLFLFLFFFFLQPFGFD